MLLIQLHCRHFTEAQQSSRWLIFTEKVCNEFHCRRALSFDCRPITSKLQIIFEYNEINTPNSVSQI